MSDSQPTSRDSPRVEPSFEGDPSPRVNPPRLVAMQWLGDEKGKAPVCFVGKGVTFDSGGISLKPGSGMEKMKYDMAGAAAVIGAIKAIVAVAFGKVLQHAVTSDKEDMARVDAENNLLLIKGAVPGPKGGYVVIKQEA